MTIWDSKSARKIKDYLRISSISVVFSALLESFSACSSFRDEAMHSTVSRMTRREHYVLLNESPKYHVTLLLLRELYWRGRHWYDWRHCFLNGYRKYTHRCVSFFHANKKSDFWNLLLSFTTSLCFCSRITFFDILPQGFSAVNSILNEYSMENYITKPYI